MTKWALTQTGKINIEALHMTKDTLFLLQADFTDENFPGDRFYCPSCTFFEGLLALFPPLSKHLEVRRIGFERPRMELVKLVGEDQQTCPTLVLSQRSNRAFATHEFAGNAFIKGQSEIAEYLAETYAIPVMHP